MGAGLDYPGMRTVLQREVEVRDGETTIVDMQAREVLVTGRVTRRGEPVSGGTVSFFAPTGGMNIYVGAPGSPAPATSGPVPMAGVTRPDGSYELLVLEPGRYSAMLRGPEGVTTPLRVQGQAPNANTPSSSFIDVPDVTAHQLDFTLGGATVSGLVIEEDSEKPVSRAFVSFMGKGTHGNGTTDAEGRFSFDLEPGEGKLRVSAMGFAPSEQDLSVGESGTDGLRIALSRGREIKGRVVDGSGRPLGEVGVNAYGEKGMSGFGRALPDGTFHLQGLGDGVHTVTAGSESAGYGFEPGVNAGATGVVVRIKPVSPLRVRAVDAAGQPVAKATVRIEKVNGASLMLPGRTGGMTDSSGIAELIAPEGLVSLNAHAEERRLSGLATVECHGGSPASVEIVLSDRRAPAPR
jgi:hypothetical protein